MENVNLKLLWRYQTIDIILRYQFYKLKFISIKCKKNTYLGRVLIYIVNIENL